MAKKYTHKISSRGVGKGHIVKEIRHPLTGKLLRNVWVTGKGNFRRNTVYKTYNSVEGNYILMKADLDNINFTKSK